MENKEELQDKFIVFECVPEKPIKHLSLPFDTEEDAISFIETMRLGLHYGSNPQIKLIITKVISIG